MKVQVRCEHSEDITSLNGFHCSHGFVFEFIVRIQLLDSRDDKEPDIEMISWKDYEFQKYVGDVVESNPFTFSCQLRMDMDQEAIASKWSQDILANEIALLRDLLAESDCKIGKLMLARLLTALDAMLSDGTSSYSQMPYLEEILQLYSDLVTLVLPHLQFYKDQHSLSIIASGDFSGGQELGGLQSALLPSGARAGNNQRSPPCIRILRLLPPTTTR
ncbi:hypothetical protein Dimus_024792 [Dionaea muscipula]